MVQKETNKTTAKKHIHTHTKTVNVRIISSENIEVGK